MFKSVKSEHLSVTPLVAYGGAALLAIVAWLSLSWAADVNAQKRSDLFDMHGDLQLLQTLRDRDLWNNRVQQSERLRASAERTVWAGETISVISAQLQSTLRQFAAQAGHKNASVSVDPEVQDVGGATSIRFDFTSNTETATAAFSFLLALSEHDQAIKTDVVNLSLNASSRSIVRISGSIPVAVSQNIAASQTAEGG